MKKWIEDLEKNLGLSENYNSTAILDAARIAAHTIERPAAPITTFLMGIAFANGKPLAEIVKVIETMAENWSND